MKRKTVFIVSPVYNEKDNIAEILDRIEEGRYGACEECGAKIPKARLSAIPYATLCVKCASHQERR